MDPLSGVLSLFKLQSYWSAAFDFGGDWSIAVRPYDGGRFVRSRVPISQAGPRGGVGRFFALADPLPLAINAMDDDPYAKL